MKFKVLNKEKNTLFPVHSLFYTDTGGIFGTYLDNGLLEEFQEGSTLIQSLGMLDSNNEEIYEGDILIWTVGNRTTTSDVFYDNMKGWCVRVNETTDTQVYFFLSSGIKMTIIGNIYTEDNN